MKACLISLGSLSSTWTLEAMREKFDKVDDIRFSDITARVNGSDIEIGNKGAVLEDYDCVFVKGSYRLSLLARAITTKVQERCYTPFKADAFTIGHDKVLTHIRLQQSQIPMPRTYLTPSVESARHVLKEIHYPIVIKFPQGTGGKGVLFADSYASASSMLDAFEVLNQPFIIQQYIDVDGRDTRCFVVGNKVVASYQRKAAPREERANIHAGGTGIKHTPHPRTIQMAVKTAKALGADILGVDILETPRGPYVIEVNVSPGLQGITQTTNVNVAEKIADYLYSRAKEFKGEKDAVGSKKIMDKIEKEQEMITTADIRGNRVLLPKVLTKILKLEQDDTVVIKAKEGSVEVSRLDIS